MRLIDAEKLYKEWTEKDGVRFPINDCDGFPIQVNLSDVQKSIREQPTIEAKPVIHAHWEIVDIIGYDYLCCSNCGNTYYTGEESLKQAKDHLKRGMAYDYCPNCGAIMDEIDESEE